MSNLNVDHLCRSELPNRARTRVAERKPHVWECFVLLLLTDIAVVCSTPYQPFYKATGAQSESIDFASFVIPRTSLPGRFPQLSRFLA